MTTTRLTKFGHSCVRLEKDGQALVIDPGVFTDPSAALGADAVLITHQHPDHLHEPTLLAAAEANPGLTVWTNGAVAERIGTLGGARVRTVGEGDTFTAAGFEVSVHGRWHAVIHPDIPRVANTGYLVDGTVFHPGDALTVPEVDGLDTLLLPVNAPWSKVSEVIDYARAVGARRALALHDGMLSEPGLAIYGGLLGEAGPGTGVPYRRLAPGEMVSVG